MAGIKLPKTTSKIKISKMNQSDQFKHEMTKPRPLKKVKPDKQKQLAAQEGIPLGNMGAMLASAGRKASPLAKQRNPRIKKMK